LAQQDLARRLAIDPGEITLVQAEAVEWPDAGLGCPAPGSFYAAVITPGYRLLFEARNQRYTYHTDGGSNLVLCQDGHPADAGTAPPDLTAPSPAPQLPIPWPEALALLQSGQVRQVVQLHSLEVHLTLADGRTLVTVEPEIDAIIRAVRQCGPPCDNIQLATE
jgi:hypothetical protein